MTEQFQHPDVNTDHFRTEKSLEISFASGAVTTLHNYATWSYEKRNGLMLHLPMTEPVEYTTADGKVGAFRLAYQPSFTIDETYRQIAYSPDRFRVIEFQHGELIDEFTEVEGYELDNYDWQPYVTVVFDTEDIDGYSVLDPRTGQSLTIEQLGKACDFLYRMSGILWSTNCKITLDEVLPGTIRMAQGFGIFNPYEEDIKTSLTHDLELAREAENSSYQEEDETVISKQLPSFN